MSNGRRNTKNDSESDGMMLFVLMAVALMIITGGLALEAILLYIPLKRLTRGNRGKGLAVFGIVIVVIGSVIFAYQVFTGDAAIAYLERLTSVSWIMIGCGGGIYFVGLLAAWAYETKRTKLHLSINDLAKAGAFSQTEINQARSNSKIIGISSIDIVNMIYLENHVNALAVVESGGMPRGNCPNSIFMHPGEECYASFSGMDLFKDVFGTRYAVQGGTVYFRVSNNITLAPRSYTAMSMPTKELQQQDSGHLLITNQRIHFQGSTLNIDFLYEEIEGLTEYTDGFQIHFSGKKERQIFRSGKIDSELAAALIRKLVMSRS